MKKSFLCCIVIFLYCGFGVFAQQKTPVKAVPKSKPTTTPKKITTTKSSAKVTQPSVNSQEDTVIEEVNNETTQQIGNPTFIKIEPERKYNYDSSDLVVRWHELIFDLIEQTQGYSPNVSARNMAYINLAAYEAMLPAYPDNLSLAGQLQDLKKPDSLFADITDFNASVAVSSALFAMVDKLFISSPFIWMEKVYALNDSINIYFAKKLTKEVVEKSRKYGEKIADWIYGYSMTDGGHNTFLRTYDMNYKLPVCTSCFEINRVADLENTGPLHPNWGKNRAFLKENQGGIDIKPKVEFSIYPNSPFYKMAMEVYNISKEVKPNSEKLQIANFWDDAASFTYSAPGHSVSILTQVLKQNPKRLDEATELYSNLTIGLNDTFIATWRIKYEQNFIRPIAYIKRYIDSKWEAALLTPPFPEFPSGHSAQSAAMATILTEKMGDTLSYIDYSKYFVGPPKKFDSFWAAANECSISRVYGGIHFRDGIDQGMEVGKIVGKNSLNLHYKK
ncbi:vanadium-dependent haloperoxidase [Emticicia sp. BO119]|uniref:vanadium-dependent haloperoxidase n=1 Tax=Emticicia sp. BO119 TaxID=2757768 RepID=UPI0015F1138B|nr:vanadium-dependent haloperoxidase [Emticicia sp. BO119]MBA4853616.1 vanadium-dependent haloperoxidase [Emticicia sp. BO119]